MGVISDAIDSLQDWVENLFRDGVKSQFDSISSLLTDTFDNTTGSGGLVQTFITGHPASFTGNAAGTGTHVWNTIEIGGEIYNIDVSMGYDRFSYLYGENGAGSDRYRALLVRDEKLPAFRSGR